MRTIMSADGTQAAANGTGPARIMIIDDHEITRAACRALLRTEGADVIADMPAGDQALAAAAALRPDVVVVDVSPAAASSAWSPAGMSATTSAPSVRSRARHAARVIS